MSAFGNSNIPSVYNSAVLDDNLEHNGGITVSWLSNSGDTLPVGESITYGGVKYSLLDPYAPEKNDAVSWRYSPKFLHPVARLERVPFYIEVQGENDEVEHMSTINFTGLAKNIALKLAQHFAVYGATDSEFASTFGTSWSADITQNGNTIITVNFDGCSIKAAASRIADALGCNVFFDWGAKTIRFIAGTTIDGASYNCFHVLGGTTNMAKKSISGIMVPVTKRLTLADDPNNGIHNSTIDHSNGGIRLTTDIILDDIYPKIELLIDTVRERRCYLTNEIGEKVKDENNNYKFYSKYYITLKYNDGEDTPFSMSDVTQIADKPLSLLFQPDYENIENSSKLAGHQFELVHYSANKTEWDIDDVTPETNKWHAAAGEFRIVFKAEGSTILPSTPMEQLCPSSNDKVTLVNVSLAPRYKQIAQEKLLSAATGIISMMEADSNSYRDTVLFASTADGGSPISIGDSFTVGGHSGIITDVSWNLDTDVAEVTVGSWHSRKTFTGSMVDKIDSINVTGGDGTTGEKGMSKAQFDALNMSGPKAVKAVVDKVDLLGVDIDEIRQQSDQQFQIWFGSGAPTASNYPASSWTTSDEKDLHVQDLYYDTTRTPASTGGRAWRYTKSNGVYSWQEVTDLDTLASLEKIADVASDGVICAGAEKQRVLIDWHNAMREYTEYKDIDATNLGVSTELTAYISAYQALWQLLNGGSAPDGTQNQSYTTVPAWIAGGALYVDTVLEDDYSGTIPSGSTVEQVYRETWNDYYAALTALLSKSDVKGLEGLHTAQSKMAVFVSYDLPSPPYNRGDLWWKLHTNTPGNNNGDLYICKTARGAQGTADIDDWMPAGDYLTSSADLMATLAEQLEENIFSKYGVSNHVVNVSWGATQPASPSVGDVWYDKTNQVIVEYDGTDWNSVDPYEVDVVNTKKTFEALMKIDQQADRSVNFYEDPEYASNAEKYDVCFRRSVFRDNFTNRDIEGELGIWLYGDGAWQHIKDNVSGIIQNYGDHIILAIYGNEVLPSGMSSYAAGLTTFKNFAEMFAQAADPVTGELKAKAGVTVHIEYVDDGAGGTRPQGFVDMTGTFRSADNEVVIDRFDNPDHQQGDTTKETATLINICKSDNSDEGMSIGVAEKEYHYLDTTFTVSDPFIKMGNTLGRKIQIGSDNIVFKEYYDQIDGDIINAFIGGGGSYSGIYTDFRFGIIGYDINDEIQYYNGIGTIANPVTFTVKVNGVDKTVTVIGGIITDVS